MRHKFKLVALVVNYRQRVIIVGAQEPNYGKLIVQYNKHLVYSLFMQIHDISI